VLFHAGVGPGRRDERQAERRGEEKKRRTHDRSPRMITDERGMLVAYPRCPFDSKDCRLETSS
jgi:hypothetical protein